MILKQLPNKFSSSPDAIPTFMLKRFSDELCLPMPEIIKLKYCQISGSMLMLFRCTKVEEIIKHKINNYRPIILTCIICKVIKNLLI